MNFLFIPNVKQVPQWKQCYFDNKTILTFFQFISQCNRLQKKIDLIYQKTEEQDKRKFYARTSDRINEIRGIFRQNFQKYFQHEQELVANFIQYKIFQISNKFKVYQALIVTIKRRSNKMQLLLQNLFIEAFYLQSANISHSSYETEIINKLKIEMSQNSVDESQYLKYSRLSRMNRQTYQLRQQVQSAYNIYSHKLDHELSFDKIKKQFRKNKKKPTSYLFIGAFMGGLMSFVAILIVMSIISNITLVTSQKFADNFPQWRGGFQFVFYIWILGLNVLFYEKSGINYKLVFQVGKSNFPSSNFLLSMASVITFILLFLMLIMFLKIDGVIQTDFTHYISLFWFSFIIYLFLPFKIFHYRERLHWIKMIGKTIFFCFFPMNFLTIWIAQQMVSLTQPFSDFFYGIFNIFADNRAIATATTANFQSAITIGVFVERFFQNIKNWLAVCKSTEIPIYDFWLPPFLGTIRAFFGFLAVVAALLNRLNLFKGAFQLWIVIITVASASAWFADVKGDWGLFQHQTGSFFVLRKKLLYPNLRFLYIFIIIFDLFLRVAWVLTIAPFYKFGTPPQNLLFVMMLAFIQIFRRGVWNVLRIQNEFIKNCGQFQATVRDDHILNEIKKQVNMKIKKNIESMAKNMQSNAKIMREDEELGPSSNTIFQSEFQSKQLIEQIQSLTYFKKLAIQMQSKPEEQKRDQLRISYQKQLFRNSLKQRITLKKVILKQSQELQKELRSISQKLILGNFSKKFIVSEKESQEEQQ